MPAFLARVRQTTGTDMKNRYEVQVRAQCPVNPTDIDCYAFTLESESMIEVEKITAFFADNARLKNIFQEALTQNCAVTLGCKAVSVGWHSGVKVICEAP